MEKSLNFKQSGFGLLEVLVSLVIITIVFLGIIKYQSASLMRSYKSYLHSLAIVRAQSFLDVLQVKTKDKDRIAAFDAWNKVNQQQLPDGHGNYDCNIPHSCTVQVTWEVKGAAQTVAFSRLVSWK